MLGSADYYIAVDADPNMSRKFALVLRQFDAVVKYRVDAAAAEHPLQGDPALQAYRSKRHPVGQCFDDAGSVRICARSLRAKRLRAKTDVTMKGKQTRHDRCGRE